MIDKFYNYDIHLEKRTETVNAMGDVVTEWSHYMTIYGRIRTLSQSERIYANKQTVFSTHRLYTDISNAPMLQDELLALNSDVTLDSETSTNRDYRIKYKDQIYRIVLVDNPFNADKFLQVDLERIYG